MDKRKEKYWYKTYIVECPVCGSGSETKQRVYGEKPENPDEWVDYTQRYDWCNEFGSMY